MKSLVYVIIIVILILLASYVAVSEESRSFLLKTFVVEGDRENTETGHNNLKTFHVGQKPTGRSMLIESKRKTQDARKRHIEYEQRDEEIEKCIKKITKNWKRTYFKRSYEKIYNEEEEKWKHTKRSPFYEREGEFYGYKEHDDWGLYWGLRNKVLNGEEICE